MIASHYRSPINYSLEIIEQAKASLERLYTCRKNADFALAHAEVGGEAPAFLNEKREEFIAAMEDDLNTADAIGVLFTLAKEINILSSDAATKKATLTACLDTFNELAGVLGLLYVTEEANLDGEIEALIEERTAARKNKDFKRADEIRDQLKNMGIILEDTPQGVKWTRQ